MKLLRIIETGFVYKGQKGSHAKYSDGHHTVIGPNA
jgi:predicted RNA binding protein YcfA (HicA-like mRNA interferase family)